MFFVLRVLCQHFFNLRDTANSIIKIPKVRSAAAGIVANTALAYTILGKWLHMLCAHPTLGEPQGLKPQLPKIHLWAVIICACTLTSMLIWANASRGINHEQKDTVQQLFASNGMLK